MQAKLERGRAAFRMRGVGLSVAILASATLSLSAPDRALAACGGAASHPAHGAASGNGGIHAGTSIAAPSGGGGGGGGGGGCPTGVNPTALRGLPTAASGRVVEPGARAARTATHARTAPTRTTNASAHLHAVGHRA
jgi:hypothetical protein